MSGGDSLSLVHFLAAASEIEGRFFTSDEADRLKREIDRRTIDDPAVRALAAQAWGDAVLRPDITDDDE